MDLVLCTHRWELSISVLTVGSNVGANF
uniref:Uncharacterized protein n=1 Tax=Arundo donax TaxID=35708 RepID=A0A0A9AQH3_ARUDO